MKPIFSEYGHKWISNSDDLSACSEIRRKVFVEEQGVSETIVFDKYDKADVPETLSLLVFEKATEKNVASVRIVFKKDLEKWYLQRVAVLKEERRKGLGDLLMILAEEKCKELKIGELYVSSQFWIKDLYIKHGFEQVGETYLEAEMLHILLKKKLL